MKFKEMRKKNCLPAATNCGIVKEDIRLGPAVVDWSTCQTDSGWRLRILMSRHVEMKWRPV